MKLLVYSRRQRSSIPGVKALLRKRKRRILIRQIVGTSMLPTFRPGQVVVAIGPVETLEVGDIVVLRHGGKDKIKRVAQLKESQEVYLLGDNPSASEDSRNFGWLSSRAVKGKVVWPRKRRSSDYSVG